MITCATEEDETGFYCVALRSIVILAPRCTKLRCQPSYHANLQSFSPHDSAGCMHRTFDTSALRAHPKIPCTRGAEEIYDSSGDVCLGA